MRPPNAKRPPGDRNREVETVSTGEGSGNTKSTAPVNLPDSAEPKPGRTALMTAVLSIGERTTNAELMADCAALGYLDGHVLDATYGLGNFWTTFAPAQFTACDLDPAKRAPTSVGPTPFAAPAD